MSKYLDSVGLQSLWQLISNKFVSFSRDNDYNYSDTYIPANGEICLVDTSTNGLRIKIGDGTTTFGNLSYLDEENNIIILGYQQDGLFYTDSNKTEEVEAYSENKLYLDRNSNILYVYSNGSLIAVSGEEISNASSSVAGIMKLYSETGENEDGTMTQKSITEQLNTKISLEIDDSDSELLIFTN